jgi:hypothetical protein
MSLSPNFSAAIGSLGALLCFAPAPTLAEDAHASASAETPPGFVVEYIFMQPRYFCAVNAMNDSADSPGQRYLSLVRQWARRHQDADPVPGEWPAGTPYVRPNIVAYLSGPSIEKRKGNELIYPRAIHVEITDAAAALLDELDALLADPGAGLAPLKPTQRYNYDSFARLLNPEGYAPRDVVVDGQRLRYPDETYDALDSVVRRYFKSYGGRGQRQASLNLQKAQRHY